VIVTYRERKAEGDGVVAEIEKLGRKAALLQLDVAQVATFDAVAKLVAEKLQSIWKRNDFDFLWNFSYDRRRTGCWAAPQAHAIDYVSRDNYRPCHRR